MMNLQEEEADAAEGRQDAGANTGAPGEARMFAGSQTSIVQSQSPAGLARAVPPGGVMTAEKKP